ncbi:hypothetical protein [Moorella sulfitireducens (nom. illeg.)]|uniref:hypothetical protein n=1 Tax=Neomoorella sulfitireducens TaxID=2972948 RepID=UPI0021AD3EC1|nr:hypothetical protein [Moorella sulfitireducens]
MTSLFKLLQPELDIVRRRLVKETHMQGRSLPGVTIPVLNTIDQDFLPALVLISAQRQGRSGARALSLAAVFQFIFLASLIHINIKERVALETLTGDFFYARFFELLCRDGNIQFITPLSHLICQIHLDAARQCEKKSAPARLHMREYLAAAAAYLGSQLCETEPHLSQAWHEIGLQLGRLWNGRPATVKAKQVIEKHAPGTVKELLYELVIQLSEKLPAKQVMAL